jgi:hypothetical protein
MTTEKAKEVLHELARLFENPEKLIGGMVATFICGGDRPIDRWSWGNRLIAWLHDASDARTFNQWKSANRSINKGAHAFNILAPCTYMATDADEEGNEVEQPKLVGFRAVPVFRIEDTQGEPVQGYEPPTLPPLSGVPAQWNIVVDYQPIPGETFGIRGSYSPDRKRITLFTENEETFFHELVHAADDRIAPLHGGQDPDQEAVAELGAAVLARLYGGRIDRDAWKYISTYHIDPAQAVRRLLSRVESCLTLILTEAGHSTN